MWGRKCDELWPSTRKKKINFTFIFQAVSFSIFVGVTCFFKPRQRPSFCFHIKGLPGYISCDEIVQKIVFVFTRRTCSWPIMTQLYFWFICRQMPANILRHHDTSSDIFGNFKINQVTNSVVHSLSVARSCEMSSKFGIVFRGCSRYEVPVPQSKNEIILDIGVLKKLSKKVFSPLLIWNRTLRKRNCTSRSFMVHLWFNKKRQGHNPGPVEQMYIIDY